MGPHTERGAEGGQRENQMVGSCFESNLHIPKSHQGLVRPHQKSSQSSAQPAAHTHPAGCGHQPALLTAMPLLPFGSYCLLSKLPLQSSSMLKVCSNCREQSTHIHLSVVALCVQHICLPGYEVA